MRSDHLSKHSKTHELKRSGKRNKDAVANSSELENEHDDVDIEDVESENDLASPKWDMPNQS